MIAAKDHASVQIAIAQVDEKGFATGSSIPIAICGQIRKMVRVLLFIRSGFSSSLELVLVSIGSGLELVLVRLFSFDQITSGLPIKPIRSRFSSLEPLTGDRHSVDHPVYHPVSYPADNSVDY